MCVEDSAKFNSMFSPFLYYLIKKVGIGFVCTSIVGQIASVKYNMSYMTSIIRTDNPTTFRRNCRAIQ